MMWKVAEVLALKKVSERRLKVRKQRVDDKNPHSDVSG